MRCSAVGRMLGGGGGRWGRTRGNGGFHRLHRSLDLSLAAVSGEAVGGKISGAVVRFLGHQTGFVGALLGERNHLREVTRVVVDDVVDAEATRQGPLLDGLIVLHGDVGEEAVAARLGRFGAVRHIGAGE